MKTKKQLCAWLAALAVGGTCPVANGALSAFDLQGYGDYHVIVRAHDLGFVITSATALQASWVGGDPLPSGYPSTFTTFCLDIRYGLSEPAYWQSGNFPQSNNGSPPVWQADGIYRAASLYNTFAPLVNFNTAAGKLQGAALQLAIWEVLYETSSSYSLAENYGDGFSMTLGSPTLRALAETMLASSANAVNHNLNSTFWDAKLDSDGHPLNKNQDLIGPAILLPEPGTYVAGALLILPFLVSTIRKKS